MSGRKNVGKPKASRTSGNAKEPGLYPRLTSLYQRMEEAYNASAREAGLSCADCVTNCCTSFFQHHTYVEWSYLWRGLYALPEPRRRELILRAEAYMREARLALSLNARPTAMCPLNEDGLCVLYSHRLMICRMHGTRNSFTLPDGSCRIFPGCVRFTALPSSSGDSCPTLDRTPFYAELATLEMEFHKRAGRHLPRVNLTLAEMIVLGPPKV